MKDIKKLFWTFENCYEEVSEIPEKLNWLTEYTNIIRENNDIITSSPIGFNTFDLDLRKQFTSTYEPNYQLLPLSVRLSSRLYPICEWGSYTENKRLEKFNRILNMK